MRPGTMIQLNAFSQFIYDNTNALDGLSTFHAMGGIHCINPKTTITPDRVLNGMSFVLFDQQLNMKAQDINFDYDQKDLSNVIVRLGGFHCYIMAGNRLKDLLETIYAQNSMEKLLTGHVYAHAVRGHILSHLALANIIVQSIDFSKEDHLAMENVLKDLDKAVVLTAGKQDFYKIVAEKLKNELQKNIKIWTHC
ncbi:hypothetical protein PR048_010641 [Dryococelus australis]|uniref:DNA-directed RNA polymerase n=1 Tax=Dryococelus australis TaxID=614101 RepID=A0ABQ9I3R0_9NEOP|nr:hypothetical protein PR048_010641 [Dryococelus australis]